MSYRYPVRFIYRDYLLSGIGLSLFLFPVALMDLPLLTQVIFSALAGLFLLHGLQSYRRHVTRIELSDEEVRIAPGERGFPWQSLTKLALSYFSVRRDGERGWMELKLVGGGGRSVRVDSRLEGFSEVAACAARAARRNGIELDPTTTQNLAALGVETARITSGNVSDV